MKRYPVAALVAVTALSLTAMPADAEQKRPGDISGDQAIGYAYDEYDNAVSDLM